MLETLLTTVTTRASFDDSAWMYVAGAVLVALVLVVPSRMWAASGLLVTIVHELGHGFAGLMTGRRVVSIRIAGNHGGLTVSQGTSGSAVWSTFWGYPVPALVGAGLVLASLEGFAAAACFAGSLLLLVSLVFMRGGLAWVVSLVAVLGGGALLSWAPPAVVTGVVLGLGMFFLVGSVRGLGNVLRAHARGRRHESDAAFLARDTGVPSGVWLFLFALVIAGCAALSLWSIAGFLELV